MAEIGFINQRVMGCVLDDNGPLNFLFREILRDPPGGEGKIVQMEGGITIGQASWNDQPGEKLSRGLILGLPGEFFREDGVLDTDNVMARVLGRTEENVLKSDAEKSEELLLVKMDVLSRGLNEGLNCLI